VADESLIHRLRSSRPRRVTVARGREVFRRHVDAGRLALRAGGDASQRRHLIVCGDDPLALRLIEELVRRYQVRVTVILSSRRRGYGPQIARLPVDIVESDRLDGEAFRQAGIAKADALALVHQDDVGNIHAALQAQELNPKLRLVIRMFNMSLGYGMRQLFQDCRVLSDAAMAAPVFVSAALGEVAPVHVRVSGRTLYVARRAEVASEDIVCGLAATAGGDEPNLLPSEQDRADLVLAVASGGRARGAVLDQSADSARAPDAVVPGNRRLSGWRATAVVPLRRLRLRRLRRRRRRPLWVLATLFSRNVRIAIVTLVGLLLVGTAVLKVALHKSWLDAGYLAILDAFAGASPDVNGRPIVKAVETLLTIVSVALIPAVTAAVVESTISLGQLRAPISDHVVVVGLGNVGTRVIRQLGDLGVPVVGIDKKQDARGIRVARELRIPYIVGEANRVETLRRASVKTCRALVVVSTDDVTNLETAVQGRALKEDLRVVLRLFDGDFADRVQHAFGITSSRSVSYLAAPAFAAAMFERQVIGTIAVSRRVLLIAEVPVCAGSELAGAVLADAGDAGEVRVIAVQTDRRRTTLWDLAPQRRLQPEDVLIVVATRAGLGRLLARTGSPGEVVGAEMPG
jgi:Trk K+ transport system NAD-binding subunit